MTATSHAGGGLKGIRTADRLAILLSGFLHPVLLSSFVFGTVISRLTGPTRPRMAWFLVSSLFSTLLPLLILLVLRWRGTISSLRMPDRQGRFVPLLMGFTCYGVGTFALWASDAPILVTTLMICYATCAAAAALLTLRWKISLHAIGIWGSLTALYGAAGHWALYLGPLALAVSWARVRLGAHTLPQVLAGGGLGALIILIQLEFLI